MTDVLETLFGTSGAMKFTETIPRTPVWHHGPVDRFDTIADLSKLSDVDSILAMYAGPVYVAGEPIIEASGGVTNRFLVSPSEAARWYERGAALELDFFEMSLPPLRRAADRLRQRLGLPSGALAKCIVYCATADGGFAPHFDAYVNVVLQLHGEKAWRLAPNTNVTDPVQHYDLVEAPYVPNELASYWEGEAPTPDLPSGEDITLRPGSALFVSRGVWHCTRSSAPTVALNFTFSQPCWADLAAAAIRRRLITDARWRAVVRVDDTDDGKALAASLGLTVDDLLRAAEEPLDAYQQTQAVFRQLLIQGGM